jgi:long-chain acyl-CoA synthetase
MLTLHALVDALPQLGTRRAVGLQGNHAARWWTYAELHAMVLRAATTLDRHGITRGQRILLHAANSPEWVAVLLGAATRGITVVPVDASESLSRLIEIARLTHAVLIVSERHDERIAIPHITLHAMTASGTVPISAGESARKDSSHAGSRTNDANANDGASEAPLPSDPAVILFTSGSTGEPRGVILTHANLMQQVQPFLRFRRPLRLVRMRMLALSPLSHVQGLILGLCIPLSIGLIVLYTNDISPPHLVRTIRSGRIRFLSTVPRVLDLLEQELRVTAPSRWPWGRVAAMVRLLGRRFRVILVGGATLPAAREAFWRSSGCLVVQGYGMTETSALATINVPLLGRAGSIGLPLHDASIRIAEDGEILVRGPHVASSFIGRSDDLLTDDGFLRTGDLARRDHRNRLFFLGRKKEVIVTAEGHNVHPAVLESLLLAQPGVRDAVLLAIARNGLEELHAVLLLDRDADAALAVQTVNRGLPSYSRIRGWSSWPDADFPRGVLQKVNRSEIAARIEAPSAAEDDVPPSSSSLDSCIVDPDPQRRITRLAQWFTAHPEMLANADELLRNRGADSIDVLQLFAALRTSATRQHDLAGSALEPLAQHDLHAPSWPFAPGIAPVRTLLRCTLLDPMLAFHTRVDASSTELLRDLRTPCFFAIDPDDRSDRLDFLMLYRALPPRFRRRLMFVMASRPSFASYLDPALHDPAWYRAWVGLLFHAGVPLFMPFTLFPTMTRAGSADGLRRAAVQVDRGFSPVATWGRGVARIAAESQIAVVPVRLRTIAATRRRVEVTFASPVFPDAARSADELHELVMLSSRRV